MLLLTVLDSSHMTTGGVLDIVVSMSPRLTIETEIRRPLGPTHLSEPLAPRSIIFSKGDWQMKSYCRLSCCWPARVIKKLVTCFN